MFRFPLCAALALGLAGCMAPSSKEVGTDLVNTRAVFPPIDPDSGPLVFEFYPDGKGLFALNEEANRGQEPFTWHIDAGELCIEIEGLSDDCTPMTLQGNRISLQPGPRPLRGTITPL
ncbi:hypothetical protein Q4555_04875 [Octadecabacter sp. 1_MG-2023]|uniref:hypothetical protein n=1 Tax=unclassified Octadecabacter TaxID=196158 RepID=UPI001C092643|nr:MULTISPECIES: hypothetical protein [unclassified Octadecabacter]MBU2994718.1 hypothetical protein [Octadecabacter sp. B2R22]MDO6733988.1 hypothetical protein [Octadecabacter sp. 1_MG-2023]